MVVSFPPPPPLPFEESAPELLRDVTRFARVSHGADEVSRRHLIIEEFPFLIGMGGRLFPCSEATNKVTRRRRRNSPQKRNGGHKEF